MRLLNRLQNHLLFYGILEWYDEGDRRVKLMLALVLKGIRKVRWSHASM
jgi:hypothetical protein